MNSFNQIIQLARMLFGGQKKAVRSPKAIKVKALVPGFHIILISKLKLTLKQHLYLCLKGKSSI